jgi:uncharacterized protein (DUF1800 family)
MIGFGERLVLFWSNHFCVSVAKGQITRATAGALEREAIRPHVFGKFSDMLLAVEKHPAMLFISIIANRWVQRLAQEKIAMSD